MSPPGRCLETFLVVTIRVRKVGVPLVSRGQRPGIVLNILQCTTQRPRRRITRLKISIVSRLRNSDIHYTDIENFTVEHLSFLYIMPR